MRTILSSFLAQKAVENKNFHVLTGDHGYALFDEIRRVAPHKFINTGVTEQAMVGCAAGMTKVGHRVSIYGLSAFIPIRVLEFIKMTICYERLPVIILGDGAGTVYTTLGSSHQCLEDIAVLRPLPITIYSPADKREMQACLDLAYKLNGPSYIRIGKADVPSIHLDNNAPVSTLNLIAGSGKNHKAIIGTGSMAITAKKLAEHFNIDAYSAPFLSDLSNTQTIETLKRYTHITTLEEHSIHGGLGSIIGEIILENSLHTTCRTIGATKTFTHGCGSYEYALRDHGLDFETIMNQLSN